MAIDRDELNQEWTPKCEMCGWTGEPVPEQGKAQTQYLNHCKTPEHKENKENKKKKEEEEAGEDKHPSPGEQPPEIVQKAPEAKAAKKASMDELSETELLTMYGDDGKRFLKRRKLEQLLGMAPDMSDKITKWVMENYDQDENAKRDLNALYMLLLNCKVKQEYAGRIVQMIMAMEQKWWNEQNAQNTGMYFPQGPDGRSGGSPGFQVFYDAYGRPVYNPQNVNQPWLNNPDQWRGYDPRYDQRPDPRSYQPQRLPNPDLEKLEKTVGELAKTVSMLAAPPKPEKPEITKDDIIELVTSAVTAATKKPELTKEDIVDVVKGIVVEKEKGDYLVAIVEELKAMRGDITRLEKQPRTPLPKDISEEGSIEVKKLDIIGSKLGDIHETVKHGMSLILSSPEDKPKQRSGEDITALDAELDRMATTGG